MRRLRRFFLSGLVVLAPSVAWADIAYDAGSTGSCDVCSAKTVSHTVSGTNTALIVSTGCENLGPAVSTITFNGDGLAVIQDTGVFSATTDRLEQWGMVAPDDGAHDIVVTYTGQCGTGNAGILVESISLTGVNQTSQPEASNKATGTGTASAVSVTTVTANAWVVDVVMATSSTNTLTADASQTARHNTNNPGSHTQGVSTEAVVTPAATSMDWTFSSDSWGAVASAWAPAAGAARRVIFIQ